MHEVAREQPALAALPEAVEPLTIAAFGLGRLGGTERVELVVCEEIRVARDDRRRLGALLLSHAHGAPFLGALERVRTKGGLELLGGAWCRRRHGGNLH